MSEMAIGKKTEGSGRKALDPYGESKPHPIRMTAEHRRRLAKLGGAIWVRGMIDYCYEALPEDKK
jgi:hypothetical protein